MTPVPVAVPDGLGRRARRFVAVHGVRVEQGLRPGWERDAVTSGVPAEVLRRAVAFRAEWGGLALPPPPEYDGGPRWFSVDVPEQDDGLRWFEAGPPRTALPYTFAIGPDDAFGLTGDDTFTPLHRDVRGWVEALALCHEAAAAARTVERLDGAALDGLDRTGWLPVDSVRGVADTWWWDGGTGLVALHEGEAWHFGRPEYRRARLFSGLDERLLSELRAQRAG